MMKFDYFDMLSGDAIYVDGVGHLRSPKLSELKPTSGIGYVSYNLYLNFLSWDKEQILKYDQIMQHKGVNRLADSRLNTFDVITLLPQTRELCCGVLSFFMVEELLWDEKKRRYVAIYPKDEGMITGEINRENFETVRQLMLQMNYINLNKDNNPPTAHSSEKSKELWERAQDMLKKQAEANKDEVKPEYQLGNIVSKICSVHPTYNILNIYELTIFQLYDAFFQIGYMRSINLNEQIFSNHGGDKFRFENWLKPCN